MYSLGAVESFLLLTILSVAYSNRLRRKERLRRAVTANLVPNMLGAWTLAAIMTLPPVGIAAAVAVYYAADWPARKAAKKANPRRYVYSALGSAVSAVVSSEAWHTVGGMLGITIALLTFSILNIGLVAAAMVASRHYSNFRTMLSDPRAHRDEMATYLIGLAIGGAMTWHVALGVVVVPLLAALHLRASRRSVVATGAYDPQLNVWAEDAWRLQVGDHLRPGRWSSVLLIDTHGSTERQIPLIIGGCLAPSDPLGRFGSNGGLAVFLPESARCGGALVASQIVQSLARQGVQATVGVATGRGIVLQDMIMDALNDLFCERDRAADARSA